MTTAILSDQDPRITQKIETFEAELVKIEADARPLVAIVETEEDYAKASAFVAKLRELIKSIEAERTGITGLLNTVVKKINAVFNPRSDRAERFKKALEAPMAAFLDRKRGAEEKRKKELADEEARLAKEAEEKRKKAEEAAGAGRRIDALIASADAREAEEKLAENVVAQVAAEPIKASTLSGGLTAERRPWEGKVLDPRKAGVAMIKSGALFEIAIAAGFEDFVSKFVRAAVKAGVREIDGVEIKQVTRIG